MNTSAVAVMSEAPVGASLSFRLALLTPLLNATDRQHWRVRSKAKADMAGMVRLATQGRRPVEPFEYALVEVIRYSTGTPDFDNMVGGVKGLIDCLQPPGTPYMVRKKNGPVVWTCKYPYGLSIIRHDGPDCLRLHVRAVKVTRHAFQETLVHVTSLRASPLEQEPSCQWDRII